MSPAVSDSDGVKAVASFTQFLDNILLRAESIKPTSNIEPALEKSDFPDLSVQLNDALGPELSQGDDPLDPKKSQRFAIIETAVRDTFDNLVATIPIESPGFAKVWNLFDILSILSDSEHCDPALLFWLVEELLDSQTIPGCRKVFDFLESRRERITSKHFKQKQLVILRTCNELLRRISRALDPAFCGRVFIFMFQSFPLGDKSSINLRGEYHVENVTTYDRDPAEAEDKMDIDGDAADDNTQKSDGQRASSKKHAEKALDPDALYPIFWSLQDSFSQPKKLFDPEYFASFKKGLETTLATFRTIREPHRVKDKDKQPQDSKRGLKKVQGPDGELATSFNPKYLTSRDLFKLEISDLDFRRNILVQVLIVMEFLLSLSAKAKEKLATVKNPNKSVIYSDELLSEEDTKWVTKMKHAISDYLKSGSEGAYFYRMVETVLSRDKNWVRWKIENCPSIELPPLKPEAFVEAKSSSSKLATTKKLRPTPMGSTSLDFLVDDDEDDPLEKLKSRNRPGLPDLKSFKKKIADHDFEIEMPSSNESKAAAIEGKASQTWLAYRMASTFKLAAFDKIDDDDKIDYLFEDHPQPEDEDTQADGEADGVGKAIMPDDSRPIVIVDGSSAVRSFGRSLLTKLLLEKYGHTFAWVPPHVTRKPEEGEVNGKDFHFVDQQAFNVMRDGDQFLAFSEETDNCQGINRRVVEGISEKGKVPVLELDRESAQQVKDMEFPARYIFLQPPPPGQLETLLRSSSPGLTDDQIKDLVKSTSELAFHASSSEGFYDSSLEYYTDRDTGEYIPVFEKAVFGSALEKAQASDANGTTNGEDVAMDDAAANEGTAAA
ncbi:THO complex subunit 1 [Naviculisporaceae sp. PSN 640]